MLERAIERAAAKAERVVSNVVEQAAAAVREIPDVDVTIEDKRLVVRGRGLLRRWLGDGALRFGLRGWR